VTRKSLLRLACRFELEIERQSNASRVIRIVTVIGQLYALVDSRDWYDDVRRKGYLHLLVQITVLYQINDFFEVERKFSAVNHSEYIL
jgi:hypothetical protein